MKARQENYLEFAQQACELERYEQWGQASDYWKEAVKHTPNYSANREWATTRACYCAARAGFRFTPPQTDYA